MSPLTVSLLVGFFFYAISQKGGTTALPKGSMVPTAPKPSSGGGAAPAGGGGGGPKSQAGTPDAPGANSWFTSLVNAIKSGHGNVADPGQATISDLIAPASITDTLSLQPDLTSQAYAAFDAYGSTSSATDNTSMVLAQTYSDPNANASTYLGGTDFSGGSSVTYGDSTGGSIDYGSDPSQGGWGGS